MLKKCVALVCTSVIGAVMIIGIAGCSPEKKATPAAAPAETGATPAANTDHGAPADEKK